MTQPDQVGSCAVIVDEEAESVCGAVASAEVLVRNPFGLFAVPVCFFHESKHRAFYRERRRSHSHHARRKRASSTPGE